MDLNNIPIDKMMQQQGTSAFLTHEDLFGETRANEEELYAGGTAMVVLGETPEGIFEQEI